MSLTAKRKRLGSLVSGALGSSSLGKGNTYSKNYRKELNTLLLRDGSTKANYQPGVGIVGTTNASRWYNAFGNDIALVLPGVNGNIATMPASAATKPLGNILDVAARIQPNSIATANYYIFGANNAVNSHAWRIDADGKLTFIYFIATVLKTDTSTAALSSAASQWVRIYHNPTSGETKFYTQADTGSNTVPTSGWAQLGTTVAGTTGNIDSDTGSFSIGSINASASVFAGKVYQVSGYWGDLTSGGVLKYGLNFSAQAKDTTSFAESANGATVTINSTAIAVPARIGDATDLCQSIGAAQPTINADGSLTFDGIAQYMKTAAFSFSQPESVYFVGKQVTWTDGDFLWDGAGNSLMAMYQTGGTPSLRMYAGVGLAGQSLATNTKGIIAAVYNGASSSYKVNAAAASSGDAGASNGGGFTLGARGDVAQLGNIQASEIILRAAADSAATQAQIIALEAAIHGVTL